MRIPLYKMTQSLQTFKHDIIVTTLLLLSTFLRTSSISARSHTFVKIDHEIISTAILLPSADSRKVVVKTI